MAFTPRLQKLIDALCCLPGVGPKSAQRMALYLLHQKRSQASALAECLNQAVEHIGHCEQCHNFSEQTLCPVCANPKRDHSVLCIVESPSDVLAIEQTGSYQGLYFILMGHLSPIEGIGPEQLNLSQLQNCLQEKIIQEVILATNPTVEGEATAHYIGEICKQFPSVKVSRIAYGVPMGGELEYIDGGTLARALNAREHV